MKVSAKLLVALNFVCIGLWVIAGIISFFIDYGEHALILNSILIPALGYLALFWTGNLKRLLDLLGISINMD